MHTLYWLRNDLRLHDNLCLKKVLNLNLPTIFLYQMPLGFELFSKARKSFLVETLSELKKELLELNQNLIVTPSLSTESFLELIRVHQVSDVVFTKEYTFNEIKQERELFQKLDDVTLHRVDQQTLYSEDQLPFKLNDMPLVFTAFRKKIEKAKISISKDYARPQSLPAQVKLSTEQFKLPSSSSEVFKGGEAQGLRRLNYYLWDSHSIQSYKETRNGMLRFDDSTKLSPWLSNGSLSVRKVYRELKNYEEQVLENSSTYWLYFELLWRDYFKFFAKKYGNKIFLPGGIQKTEKLVLNQEELHLFDLWKKAQTECDFVNANMNELNRTGWMSNRGRQNVASYLAKTLKVSWILGAQYFERNLIDYNCASNWGNWAYLAGVGSDPRDRIFNTTLQAKRYDPEGHYRSKFQ